MILEKGKSVIKVTDLELETLRVRQFMMSENTEELSSLPGLIFQVKLTVRWGNESFASDKKLGKGWNQR